MEKLKQEEFQKKAEAKKEEERKFLMASLLKGASALNMQAAAAAQEQERSIMKSEKIDIYTDPRDAKEIEIPDKTDIICKHFMEAVENDKYGFFWVCPNNGDTCQYRHCLPAGMVILKDAPLERNDDEIDGLTLEERLEEERSKLRSDGLTRVTKKSFEEWKLKQAQLAEEEIEAKRVQAAKKHGGKGLQVMSGRMLFKYDPTLFKDDDNALDADGYDQIDEADEEEEKDDGGQESKEGKTTASAPVDEDLFKAAAA